MVERYGVLHSKQISKVGGGFGQKSSRCGVLRGAKLTNLLCMMIGGYSLILKLNYCIFYSILKVNYVVRIMFS